MQSDLSFDCIKHINQKVLSFEKIAISQKSQFHNSHNFTKITISQKSQCHFTKIAISQKFQFHSKYNFIIMFYTVLFTSPAICSGIQNVSLYEEKNKSSDLEKPE